MKGEGGGWDGAREKVERRPLGEHFVFGEPLDGIGVLVEKSQRRRTRAQEVKGVHGKYVSTTAFCS